MQESIKKEYLFPVIAGCGLIGTCLGICVNISGNFFSPIASEFGIGRGSAALTLTVYNLVQALSGMTEAEIGEFHRLLTLAMNNLGAAMHCRPGAEQEETP